MHFLHLQCLPLQLSNAAPPPTSRPGRAPSPNTATGKPMHIIDKARAGISSAAIQIVLLAALFA